ncbi:CRISPR system Cascade subunit CasE [Rhodoblastus acidophilus]|uniref:type I-E CRISPR-associated protein Cas6/Cse3/CasE n=1 Tax=Rhodoblastus acidophilus TaxID=1074 RepID=UPI002224CAB6|nr:type I-E CRISPR-associated protein Cas6/Cse3/CasE [Rhodoblastus acidophilus]MCW2318978.1 CRISPR system Cascade subunit CasE [Rhodoblastus acidophilus]
MSELFFSRARLRPGHERLGPILFPDNPAARMGTTHRLVWSMFPRELSERPFLYRENAPSHAAGPTARCELMVLSRLAPDDAEGLFDIETKVFAPVLRAGQHLRFSLRANPTTQKSETDADGRRKSRRYDVVMAALKSVEKGAARAEARPGLIQTAGLDWLKRQGERAGFRLPDPESVRIDGYEQFDVDPENRRATRGRRAVHSRLEFEGTLEVTEPQAFLRQMTEGFGRARAFGHGLMLIRRG